MKKAEYIAKYGEDVYKRHLEQCLAWNRKHRENLKVADKKYRDTHPEKVKANHHKTNSEQCRKGGRNYEKHLKDNRTGLQGERNSIRWKHRKEFREIKDTLAQEVELHHEWVGDTAEYRGMAFVEKNAHQHGFIDVILLLDGEITLLTEEDVKMGRGIKV